MSNEEQSISVVEITEDWWIDVNFSAISRSSAYFAWADVTGCVMTEHHRFQDATICRCKSQSVEGLGAVRGLRLDRRQVLIT